MITLICGKFVEHSLLACSFLYLLSEETLKQHTGLNKSDAFSLSSDLIAADTIFVSTGCIDLLPVTCTHVAKPFVLHLLRVSC